jgi:hypothetical protein
LAAKVQIKYEPAKTLACIFILFTQKQGSLTKVSTTLCTPVPTPFCACDFSSEKNVEKWLKPTLRHLTSWHTTV